MGGVSCICGPQSEVQRHGWVPNGDAEVPAEMKGRKWLNMSSIRTTDFFPGPLAASPPTSGERCVGRRLHRRISSPFFPTTSKATGRTRQSCLGGGLEVCSPLLLPLRLAVIVSAADPCFAEPGHNRAVKDLRVPCKNEHEKLCYSCRTQGALGKYTSQ